jgi:hypothetical protein
VPFFDVLCPPCTPSITLLRVGASIRPQQPAYHLWHLGEFLLVSRMPAETPCRPVARSASARTRSAQRHDEAMRQVSFDAARSEVSSLCC